MRRLSADVSDEALAKSEAFELARRVLHSFNEGEAKAGRSNKKSIFSLQTDKKKDTLSVSLKYLKYVGV